MKAVLIALMVFLSLGTSSQADEVFTFVVKKQEEKVKTRWTLAEWLETKNKMRLMDLWLALHSPSPYEFIVSSTFLNGSQTPGSKYTGGDLSIIAYNSIFGLEVKGQTKAPDDYWQGVFRLRVFGYHDQSTNITLHGGLRTKQGTVGYRNPLAGVSLSIYLAKAFGIDGSWMKILASTPNASGLEYSGSEWEGGAFLEYQFFRIFGKYYSHSRMAGAMGSSDTGFGLGAKLYF